jgi:hypothetical protein
MTLRLMMVGHEFAFKKRSWTSSSLSVFWTPLGPKEERKSEKASRKYLFPQCLSVKSSDHFFSML